MSARKWIIPLILVSLLIFLLSLRQLSDPDLGFHLKYGRWIVDNHRIPVTDQSTYTVSGHSYTDLHWLFQVILYLVYRSTGYAGISLLVCIVSLALAFLILLRNRIFQTPEPVTWILLLAGFLIIDPRITPRPEMFSFLFLTLVLLVLDLYTGLKKNHLFFLPIIMLFWCNMHALFILGLGVMAVYFICSWTVQRKPDRLLLKWTVISFLACFLNPYGINSFLFPFQLLSRFDPENIYNQHIREFMPFFKQPQFVLRDYLFLAMTGLTMVAAVINRRKTRRAEIILLVFFVILAFRSIRNIPLFVLVAIPVISRLVPETVKKVHRFRKEANLAVYILLILIPLAVIPRLLTNAYYLENNAVNKTGLGLDPYNQPVRAAEFILDHKMNGRILNSVGSGGWLSWVLPQPVFIDGRLEVMEESLYTELVQSWNMGLPALIAKYKPGLIIYNPLIYTPWTLQLKNMPGWRLVHLDGKTAVFTSDTCRSSLPSVNLSQDTAAARVPRYTFWHGFYRPVDFALMDDLYQARFMEQFFQGGSLVQNRDAVIYFNAANQKYRLGDNRGALAGYDTAIMLNPSYAKAYNNRGILRASALNDLHGAIGDFTRALAIDPSYGDAYLGRGTAWFMLKDTRAACADWLRASSLGNSRASMLLRQYCKDK